MAVTDYDATAANNTSVGGVNIQEGWSPSDVNNAIRALMADIASGITDGDFATTSGLQPVDATLTALAGVSTSADDLILADGADSFTTLATTAYGQSLLALASASALKSSLGTIGVTASSITNPGYVSLDLTGNGTADLTLQWGTGSIGGNTTGTITYPISFTSFAVCVANGGRNSTGNEGDVHVTAASGLSSQSIIHTSPSTAFYAWVAVGK